MNRSHHSSMRLSPLASALCGAFAAMAAQHAVAQTAQAAPAAAPVQLEAVTVQGTRDSYKVEDASSPKFTAPLLDTPKSVTVIPSEVIRQTGANSLQEALRTTPGITFGAGEGGNPIGDRPFIRGFDSMADIFTDGVRDAGSQTRESFNIERVEVVKGPSSAYGGRGAVGGAINLVTKQPSKENFASGSVALGTDSFKRATVDGNYVVNDNVAFRLNAMVHDQDIPGRNAVDLNKWGIAPSVTFGLNSPTRVTLSYYHMQSDGMPDYSLPFRHSGTARSKANPDGPVDVNRDNFYGLKNRDFQKNEVDIATAQIQHDFGNGLMLRNTTRYGRSANDYIVTNPDDSAGNVPRGAVWRNTKSRDSVNTTLVNQTDLMAEFNTGAIKHNFVAGVEFSREETDNDPYTVATGNRDCRLEPATSFNCTSLLNPNPNDPWAGSIRKLGNTTASKTTTRSIYAFDTMEFNRQWSANLGVRYDNYSTSVNTPRYVNASGATVAATSLHNDASFFNYQAGVVYKPLPNGSIYVNYATASTPSGQTVGDGADNLSATNKDLDPERSRAVELGTKWDLLDGKLSLTGAIFQIKKSNARVQVDANTYALAGKQEVKGFEVGFAGHITDKWGVFGGYTRLNSKLKNNGTYGTNAANDGNQFPNTPKDSFSLWTTYQVLPKLTIGAGAFYVAKVFGNTANTLYIPSYTRFDAMAAYTVNKNLSLQLNVQNLTDKTYFTKAYSNHYASLGEGRSAIVTANWRF